MPTKEETKKMAVAQLKYFRVSSKKARPLLKSLVGKKVTEVLAYLKFNSTRVAPYLIKLINSAVANAKNMGLDETKLIIKEFTYDEGPVLKRFRPGYRGIAFPYKRRLGHIKLILIELEIKEIKKEKIVKKIKKIVNKKAKNKKQ